MPTVSWGIIRSTQCQHMAPQQGSTLFIASILLGMESRWCSTRRSKVKTLIGYFWFGPWIQTWRRHGDQSLRISMYTSTFVSQSLTYWIWLLMLQRAHFKDVQQNIKKPKPFNGFLVGDVRDLLHRGQSSTLTQSPGWGWTSAGSKLSSITCGWLGLYLNSAMTVLGPL